MARRSALSARTGLPWLLFLLKSLGNVACCGSEHLLRPDDAVGTTVEFRTGEHLLTGGPQFHVKATFEQIRLAG